MTHSTTTEQQSIDLSHSAGRYLLLVMAVAAFVSVLNNTMVNVAIPLIAADLDVMPNRMGWIITGYALVFAVAVAMYGRVSDLVSLRKTFLWSLVVFAAGSLVSAMAPNLSTLVFGRCLQAAGAAAVPALAFGSIAKLFPAGSRGTAFGIISSSVGAGAAAGPLLGGLGVSIGGWHFLFVGTFVLLSAVFVGACFLLPDTESQKETNVLRRFGLPGGVLLATAAALTLFGFTEVEHAGWSSPKCWGSLLGAALAAIAFSFSIRHSNYPFVPPALFRNRSFVAASLVAFMAQFGYIGGALFLVPLLVINHMGLSTLAAGLIMAPSAVAVALLSPTAGRLSDRYGSRVVLAVSLLIMLTGSLCMSTFAADSSPLIISAIMLGMGVGYVGIISPAANAASTSLTPDVAGVGFGVYQLFFFLGGGSGAALLGSFLAYRQGIPPNAFNPFYNLAPAGTAYSDAFLLGSAALLVSFLLVAGLDGHQKR